MDHQPLPKLRLMCSYGGHIIPRPRAKSLCYAGGETRIVSLNAAAMTNLASLLSHIASSLSIPSPFSLKYQLPNHDLDSLISVLTDEDLLILVEELQRLSSTSGSPSSRIRLFVFPAKSSSASGEEEEEESKKVVPPSSAAAVMQHPKQESWFFDALKSAKIMQKGRNCGGGLGFECEHNGGGEDGGGIGLQTSAAESMVLETSSSFGSTSSSASLTNSAAVKSNVDDAGIGLRDSVAKLTPSDTIPSEYSSSTVTSYLQTGAYHDPYNPKLVASTPTEFSVKLSDISSGIQFCNTVTASPYQLDQNPIQHQKVQYIQVDSPYTAHSPLSGLVPVSSFYPLYHTQIPHQQPVYFVPIPQTQAYTLPGYHGFAENVTLTPSQAPPLINPSYVPPQVVHTEPAQTDAQPNLASQVHDTAWSGIQLAGPTQQQQQLQQPSGLYEKPHQAQPFELHDEATVQIYKSQPPPPPVPSQYQTTAKATEVLLSEALDQLHTDSLKQQIKTSQPQ